MKRLLSQKINYVFLLSLGLGLVVPQNLPAQSHVVSPSDIQKDVASASAARQRNQEQVKNFLSSEEAQRAMKKANINPQQVTNAVSQLNNGDLARLAARSAQAQKDFAAGSIDNHDLLLILVAIAALILIIVAVH